MGRSAKKVLKPFNLPLQVLVAVIPFLTGIFYEWQSAVLVVALVALLIVEAKKNKRVDVEFGWPLLFSICVVIFHVLTAFWAVDKGMVWLGVLKFLPLPLFVLAASRKEDVLKHLPLSGVVMTIASLILSPFDKLKGHITVRGRLGGFFEYPNTFAMFLLVCLILVLFKEKIKLKDWIFAAVFLAGIALSGSRTVLILTALTALIFVIWVKDKKIKIISACCVVACGALGAVYLITKLSSLSNMSTFYGRLLYYSDALPVILKHPFGLGYYGYYYSQGAFQTGVYSVVHIHNDLLQILLDIGWIPAILAVVMFVKAFIRAKFQAKVLLAMMALHLLFDFDMQFVSMSVILLAVVMSASESKIKTIKANNLYLSLGVLTPVCAFAAVYFGLASFFAYLNKYDVAAKIYPSYTESQKYLLFQSQSNEEMEAIAGRLLKNNPNLPIANDAMARLAFSKGDINGMMGYKETAIRNNKYVLSEYTDYIDMLSYSITLFTQAGDGQSAVYCMNRCIQIESDLRAVDEGTSALGRKIDDQPQLTLPEEYSEYIVMLQNAKSS